MKKMITLLLLTTILTGVVSCGSKNKVNSSQLGGSNSPFGSSYPIQYSQQAVNGLQQIIAQNQCTRRPSVVFNVQSSYPQGSSSTIGGTFQVGPLSGEAGSSYVGINYATKDIMVVTKILRSGAVFGFNVEISFCDNPALTSQYFSQREIALPSSQYTIVRPTCYNWQVTPFAPFGITLYERIQNGIGSLTAQATCVYVGPYQNPQTYPGYFMGTTFDAPF